MDNNGNKIFEVNESGVHSIDHKSLKYSLEEIGDTLDKIDISSNGEITASDLKTSSGGSFNSISATTLSN
jgi:hypothetical protein